MLERDRLVCRFCRMDGRARLEEVQAHAKTPPMFRVKCYNCGRESIPKGTITTAIRAWYKTK